MWLLRGIIKNREVAELILRDQADKLTDEQKAYLLEAIRMGLEAEEYLKEVEKKLIPSSLFGKALFPL